jgi:hypothetical protein
LSQGEPERIEDESFIISDYYIVLIFMFTWNLSLPGIKTSLTQPEVGSLDIERAPPNDRPPVSYNIHSTTPRLITIASQNGQERKRKSRRGH